MKRFMDNYLEQSQIEGHEMNSEAGPVITISRECGCSSNRIAIKLSKILTGYSFLSEKKKNIEWRWLNKEVIINAVEELKLSPDKIKEVFMKEAKMSLNEINTAFSTEKVYDVHDQQVIEHIVTFMKQVAVQGHCIIVGRAANMVVTDIPASLAIRLQAPLEWRINRIKNVSNMNYTDARDYVLAIDRQRELFAEHVAGRKLNNCDFDVVFNYSTLTDDMIVDAIINMLKNKKIIVTR